MASRSSENEAQFPEKQVGRLLHRLQRHNLWDIILVLFPPLLAVSYLLLSLLSSGFVSVEAIVFSASGALGVVLALIFHRVRPAASPGFAARLIDRRVGGKDRFVTLATIDPSFCSTSLLERVRQEASVLLQRFDVRRDFPYRVKRAFPLSLAGSLALVFLFHLLLPAARSSLPPGSSGERLEVVAQEISKEARFLQLAKDLGMLAARIRERGLSAEERSWIRHLLKEIEDRMRGEEREGSGGGKLLGRAAEALRELEEGTGSGGGGGGLKFDRSGDREGKGKRSADGGGGEGEGRAAVLGNEEPEGGKASQGVGKRERKGSGKSGAEEGVGREEEKGKGRQGAARGKGEGKGGKGEREKVPRGKAPERFRKEGEPGEKGVKGARFVIVELPEQPGPSAPKRGVAGGRGLIKPKVPVSNVPLPPPVGSGGLRERQRVPLEYRGLIAR